MTSLHLSASPDEHQLPGKDELIEAHLHIGGHQPGSISGCRSVCGTVTWDQPTRHVDPSNSSASYCPRCLDLDTYGPGRPRCPNQTPAAA